MACILQGKKDVVTEYDLCEVWCLTCNFHPVYMLINLQCYNMATCFQCVQT